MENAEKNNISSDYYKTYCGNVIGDKDLRDKIGTEYNIICANIVADVLIGMSTIFSQFLVKNGLLIMSGVISERKNEVIDAAFNNGFELIEIHEKDGWVAIAMKNIKW